MLTEQPLLDGQFLHRPHRFGAYVRIAHEEWYCHVAASGRLRELLYPGNRVLVRPLPPGGKTRGRITFAATPDGWVSVDTQLPTRLAAGLLRAQRLPPFSGYAAVRAEYPHGDSRLDFRLDGPSLPPCLIEVKSVTLVADGVARFPDAPTARGARHLEELRRAVADGWRGAVLFLVQRADAVALSPHDEQDPAFGAALRVAVAAGVEVYAYPCRVEPPQVSVLLARPLPVRL